MLQIPPDERRCTQTTRHGHRCRSERLAGDGQTLCYFHFTAADKKRYGPQISDVTSLIIRPRERLNTPHAVNRVLTRILRLLAEGRISSREASALGYIGQLISGTLPYLERAAARKEAREQEAPAMGAEALAGFQAVLQSLQPAQREPQAIEGSPAPVESVDEKK